MDIINITFDCSVMIMFVMIMLTSDVSSYLILLLISDLHVSNFPPPWLLTNSSYFWNDRSRNDVSQAAVIGRLGIYGHIFAADIGRLGAKGLMTEVFLRRKKKIRKWIFQKTNGTIRKCSSRAFQWMVMSVCFDNLKFLGGNFCGPRLVTEVTISKELILWLDTPPLILTV
jgi:hypothetical protein